jgi:YegS/Rv2252/BmrU family lipid kinase
MTATALRIAAVLNAGSGDGSADAAKARLEELCRSAGHDVTVTVLREAGDLECAMADAIRDGVDVAIAGGGDGTVNSVANAIAGHDITLGVLPLGTLNHFARDLGIPLALDDAVRVILEGHTLQVDVGAVNGTVFLNNSSVGLYPRIVQLRERYRSRGAAKWLVAAWATFRVTQRQRPLRMKIVVDGRDVVRTTPLIFIGNNEYRMAGFDAGTRASLGTGQLALYVVKAEGQWRLFQLVWRILVGTATDSGALAMALATDATVDLPFDATVHSVPVAIDGEVTTMTLPLRYETRPRALRVIVPA